MRNAHPRKGANSALTILAVVSAMALLLAALAPGTHSARAQIVDTPTHVPNTTPDDSYGVQNLPPIEGKLNPPQYPDMDYDLNRIVQQVETGQFTAQDAAANVPVSDGGSVAVTLFITEGFADPIASYLESNGASPRNVGADYIEAYIPVSLLPQASEQEGVITIRSIIPPRPVQGDIASGGLFRHGVPVWYLAGIRGQDVKIGIIDTDFEGFRELMGTELPTSVQARCYTDVGVFTSSLSNCENAEEEKHGVAVTETIFDIASKATYYISNPHSQGDLQAAVNWMIEQDVDVINMSLGWVWDGPGDGTSPSSTSPLNSVDVAVANGITWVNAAGNSAESTWFGHFANPDFASDTWHNFDGDDECNEVALEAGQMFVAQLRWDDRWGGASRDLDLHLLKSGRTVASSESAQSGGAGDDPLEYLNYTPAVDDTYCLAVSHNGGAAPSWIQLQGFIGEVQFEHYTVSGSIINPAESANPGMFAVGATQGIHPWNTYDIEEFSSQGPTPDGRIKPDIVGADGGATASLRSTENPNGNFFGTSQASAHVAGLVALVKQRFRSYTPKQIGQYLKNNAKERGAVPNPNNIWGYGFAYLPPSDASEATPSPRATPISLETILNRIAFASDRDSTGGADGMYVMNADGSDVTYLMEYPSGDPIWSPDGSRIAFDYYDDGNHDIYVMNADGSGRTNLTNHPADDRSPSWSPDGRRIAFVSLRDGPGTDLFGRNAEIYVMNADGSAQTRLTNDPATDKDPSWSPDGQRIAFYSKRDDSFCGDLYVMNADGSSKTSLTKNLPYGGWSASWSPDGQRIAFVTGCGENKQNPGFQIYSIDTDGSNPKALTDNIGDDEYPSWSPDGSVILFSSRRDNYVQIGDRISYNSEIYVMNADGSAQTNLTNHPAGDNIPKWLPVTIAASTPTATPTFEPTVTYTPTPEPTVSPTSIPQTPEPTRPPAGTPTPEPTATPVAPTVPVEVLNRLSALEILVATLQGLISTLEGSISALNSNVSALANRVAALEADASRPTPVPTPTPSTNPCELSLPGGELPTTVRGSLITECFTLDGNNRFYFRETPFYVREATGEWFASAGSDNFDTVLTLWQHNRNTRQWDLLTWNDNSTFTPGTTNSYLTWRPVSGAFYALITTTKHPNTLGDFWVGLGWVPGSSSNGKIEAPDSSSPSIHFGAKALLGATMGEQKAGQP